MTKINNLAGILVGSFCLVAASAGIAKAETMCGCLTIKESRTLKDAKNAGQQAMAFGIRPGRPCHILWKTSTGRKIVASATYLGKGKFSRWTSPKPALKCVRDKF